MLHVTLKDRKRNIWISARTRVTDARERCKRKLRCKTEIAVCWTQCKTSEQQVECANTELETMVGKERKGKTTNEMEG